MEQEEAIQVLRDWAQRTLGQTNHQPEDMRAQTREALLVTTPKPSWDHMEPPLKELLDPTTPDFEEGERRHQALSIIFGVLFPEWETGGFTPDLSFLQWLGQNCGWRGFDKAAVEKENDQ